MGEVVFRRWRKIAHPIDMKLNLAKTDPWAFRKLRPAKEGLQPDSIDRNGDS